MKFVHFSQDQHCKFIYLQNKTTLRHYLGLVPQSGSQKLTLSGVEVSKVKRIVFQAIATFGMGSLFTPYCTSAGLV